MKPLTPREWEIAQLVAEALSNKEIAFRLGITAQTVKNMLQRAYMKLGIHSRLRLTLWVLEQPPQANGAAA